MRVLEATADVAGPDTGSERRVSGGLAAWAGPAALVLWAATWHLRNSVLFAWSPVEPIWLGSAAVLICVIHRIGQRRPLPVSAFVAVSLLVVAFAPGAMRVAPEGYGPTKLALMVFVTLPIFCAAIVLLDTRAAKVRWLWLQVGMAVVVGVAAVLDSDVASLVSRGRLSLATADTISTARLVGIGALVLVLYALTSVRSYWWALIPALPLVVVVLEVGSRGPAYFLAIAVAVTLIVSRTFNVVRRLLSLAVLSGLLVVAFDYLNAGGAGGGGARVLEASRDGFSDEARRELLHSAVRLGYDHPGGIGWGGFATHSKIGAELANSDGNAYAHNVLAEAFAEGGLIALFGLAGLIGWALWRLHRASIDPMMAVLLGTTVFWLLNALVSYDLIGNRFLWISIAAALTAYPPGRSPT